jgi:restriction endonuclease Mrr
VLSIPTYERFIEPILRYLAEHPNGARARDAHEAAANALGLDADDRRGSRAEPLADDEALVLAILNDRLAELVPAPAAMPARVEQAMLEAERLLAKYARG